MEVVNIHTLMISQVIGFNYFRSITSVPVKSSLQEFKNYNKWPPIHIVMYKDSTKLELSNILPLGKVIILINTVKIWKS